MPRVLFVSHHFPPDISIGSKRSLRFAKELRARGWHVDVLAAAPLYHDGKDERLCEGLEAVDTNWTHAFEPRPWARWLRRQVQAGQAAAAGRGSEASVPTALTGATRPQVRTKRGALDRVSAAALQLEVPDSMIGWFPVAVAAGQQRPRPDVVLATVPRFTSALVATQLSHHFDVPLVLDYRDPWQDEFRRARQPAWRRSLEDRLEQACLDRAAGLSATTPSIAALLRRRSAAKVAVVLNAAEPERMKAIVPHHFACKTLVYVGALYDGRGLADAMAALRDLPDWHLHYAGPSFAQCRQEAADAGVQDRVTAAGPVDHRGALALQRGATANLCVVGPSHFRQIPGKLYEQIATGRPVILLAPEGSDAQLVTAGLAQVHQVQAGEPAALAAALAKLQHTAPPSPGAPAEFSVDATMDALDDLLRDASGLRPRPTNALRLCALGDLMLPERVAAKIEQDPQALTALRQVAPQPALVIANLETPLSLHAGPQQSSNPLQPTFVAGPAAAQALKAAGIDVLTLANNHILDAGPDGIAETRSICAAAGMAVTGAGRDLEEARKPAIVERGGVAVGILACSSFCTATGRLAGTAPMDLRNLEQDIARLRRDVDRIVVSVHAGIEYADLPSAGRRAFFLALTKLGADVVLGHHPHVWQGQWQYGGIPIVASLGNALADTVDPEVKQLAHARTALVLHGLMDPSLDDVRTEEVPIARIDLMPRGCVLLPPELLMIGPEFGWLMPDAAQRQAFLARDASASQLLVAGTDPRFAAYDHVAADSAMVSLQWKAVLARLHRLRPRHIQLAAKWAAHKAGWFKP